MKHIISAAIAFAVKHHEGQFDKAGMPYILHPLKVMYYVKSNDEELMAIAVLHDVIEDCFTHDHEAGYAALKAIGMTPRVIAGVRALTKIKGTKYEDYIDNLIANIDAVKVKMADLRHNMDVRRLLGVTDKDIKRIEKYAKTYHRLEGVLG
jgi:(p)ppGpp synthase/HD superfamily hydrolase